MECFNQVNEVNFAKNNERKTKIQVPMLNTRRYNYKNENGI